MHEALLLSGGSTLELQIYGEIGEHFLFGGGIGPQWVADQLKQNPHVRDIKIKMSSPGGNVWDGMAIRSMLQSHPARVEIDIEGLAASAASVVAMAADKIRMHTGSAIMIHTARGHTYGDAAEHQKTIQRLEAITDQAAELYARRCGKKKAEMLEKMLSEAWFTPEQAVEYGLADEVVSGLSSPPRMTFDLKRYGYEHVPPHVAALMVLGESPKPETDPTQKQRRTEPMSIARIAMALGADQSADEATVMSALDRLKSNSAKHDNLLVELRAITSTGANEELLGAVRGLTEAAAQVPKLQAAITAHETALDNSKRDALLAADKANPKGRKLTPATEKLYMDKPVAELEAFLKVASIVMQMNAGHGSDKQPKVDSEGADTSDSQGDELKHNGKTWTALKPFEKHNLYVENRTQYDAMSAQHKQRIGA